MKQLPADLRTLALLLHQGLSLHEALHKVAQRNGEANDRWERCSRSVAAGSKLDQALVESGFPEELTCPLARGDEDLPAVLRHLAELMEEQRTQRQAWKAALWYPVLVSAGLILNVLILNWLVDQYTFLVEGASLPPITRWVLAIHGLIKSWGLALGLVPFGLAQLLTRPQIRIRIPVAGAFLRSREAYAFMRWLDLSLGQGCTLPQAFRQASQAGTVPSVMTQLEAAATELERGSSFPEALKKLTLFPPLACWLLEQAEGAQFRQGALNHAALALKGHNENRLKVSLAFVEPVLLLLIGLTLLLILGALFLPLFSLLGTL